LYHYWFKPYDWFPVSLPCAAAVSWIFVLIGMYCFYFKIHKLLIAPEFMLYIMRERGTLEVKFSAFLTELTALHGD
jgi:hypothetical protein